MRGMKKWLPFKSLNGQYEVLKEMEEEKKKIKKPELSEDDILEINSKLNNLKKGEKCKLIYYKQGRIIEDRNLIFSECDPIYKKLKFDSLIISFEDILSLN